MDRVLVRLIAATSFLALALLPARSEPEARHSHAGRAGAAARTTSILDYVNPDAPKGGAVTYCVVGSFDNLNPFILKSLRTTARGMIDTVYGNLVFEPLMQRNYNEPFSLYGLLADSADDGSGSQVDRVPSQSQREMVGRPAGNAGGRACSPTTFSRTRVAPTHSDRMSMIAKLEKTGEHSVKFTFNDKANREFPLIVALTPIVPKHAFDKDTFDKTTLKPLIGSGPYTVDKVLPGQRIVFKRNPDYWGGDVLSKRGFDNFDHGHHRVFSQRNAKTEASSASAPSMTRPIRSSVSDIDFPAFRRGDVKEEYFDTGIPRW
ncbi:ABC transporter substrate-binding protein [Mesorhizobium atlanticum]